MNAPSKEHLEVSGQKGEGPASGDATTSASNPDPNTAGKATRPDGTLGLGTGGADAKTAEAGEMRVDPGKKQQ
ncbi:hypothetical protein EMMF5_004051 [Cystobasidiomycetes sp. EMM_F5]